MRLEHMFEGAQVTAELVATDCEGSFSELLMGACRGTPALMGREQELLATSVERRVVGTRTGETTALLHLQEADLRKPWIGVGLAPRGIRLPGARGEPPRLVFLVIVPDRARDPQRLRRRVRTALSRLLRDRTRVTQLLQGSACLAEARAGADDGSVPQRQARAPQHEIRGIQWDLAMPYAHVVAELDRIETDLQELSELLQGCRSATSDMANAWQRSPHALPALITHLTDVLTVAQEMLDAVGSASQGALRMDSVVKQTSVSAFEH